MWQWLPTNREADRRTADNGMPTALEGRQECSSGALDVRGLSKEGNLAQPD